MLPLRSVAFLMSFFGMSTLSLMVPIMGAAHYIMIYLVFPEHAWWHRSIEQLGIRYSMTAASCMMLGMLVNLPRLPSLRPMLNLTDVSMIGLTIVVLLSELTGLTPSPLGIYLTEKFVKMMIFVFCLTRLTATRKNYTIIMWALVLGSLYIGYDAWTAPRGSFETSGRLEHVGGPDFRHSSGLAAHMAAMLPLLAAVFMTCKSWMARLVVGTAGALTVNTIVLCRTRSAFIGLFVGGIVAILLAPKRHRMKTVATLVIALSCAYTLTDSHYWDRMMTLNSPNIVSTDQSATIRIEIWKSAFEIIREHPLGVGIGNFEPTIARVNPTLGSRAAHNSFILCWAELGIQGLVLFLIIVIGAMVQSWQCKRWAMKTSDPKWVQYMSYGLILSLTVSITTQMFTERLYTEAFWWILAFPGCLKRVILGEMAMANSFVVESFDDCRPELEGTYTPSGGIARGAFA